MNTTKIIAGIIVIALIGLPTLSFARARGGGYGGGYSSGSRTSSPSGNIGSRGSRTYDQNGAKPIEQSTTPKPSAATPPSAALVYAAQSFVGWSRRRCRRVMDRSYVIRRDKQQCGEHNRGRRTCGRDRHDRRGVRLHWNTPHSDALGSRSVLLFHESTATRCVIEDNLFRRASC